MEELIYNKVPLELDKKRFNRTNNSFIQSSDFYELREIIDNWVKTSIVPAIKRDIEWRDEWHSDDFLLKLHQDHRDVVY